MIPAGQLEEWAGLLEIAAARLEATIREAVPGSAEYTRLRELASDFAEAAEDARWHADEARDADEARAEIHRLRSGKEGHHAPA
jgi:hypothetical protein